MTKLTFMSVFSHMSNVNDHLWPDKRFHTLDLGVLSERLAYTSQSTAKFIITDQALF